MASVESFRQNNFTANLAADFRDGKEDYSYWLGLQAHNELQTNTLGTDAGGQISQYYGHWAQDHPNVEEGTCVKSVLKPNGDNFDQVIFFLIFRNVNQNLFFLVYSNSSSVVEF